MQQQGQQGVTLEGQLQCRPNTCFHCRGNQTQRSTFTTASLLQLPSIAGYCGLAALPKQTVRLQRQEASRHNHECELSLSTILILQNNPFRCSTCIYIIIPDYFRYSLRRILTVWLVKVKLIWAAHHTLRAMCFVCKIFSSKVTVSQINGVK